MVACPGFKNKYLYKLFEFMQEIDAMLCWRFNSIKDKTFFFYFWHSYNLFFVCIYNILFQNEIIYQYMQSHRMLYM